jgi:hypothetical protein
MNLSLRVIAATALLGLVAGCATRSSAPPAAEIQAFSSNRPGTAVPRGWEPWTLSRTKAPTQYELVVDPETQQVVVHAYAERAASGMKQRVAINTEQRPIISWRWRVTRLIEGADSTDRHAEDSPVRLLLFFDGDRRSLPLAEQAKMDLARIVSGREMPYATLMYIWENRLPVGEVIPSSHTSRVRMIVAGSGRERLGRWKDFERNVVEDFRRAYGEPPGPLIGIGIMTDTDNTGGVIDAYYGDISIRPSGSASVR